MRLAGLLPALLCLAHLVAAFHFPITAQPRPRSRAVRRDSSNSSGTFGAVTLNDQSDLSYYTNITLNGQSFAVQIDTGSSDLWVAGTVSGAKSTGKTSGVQYAVGEVQGPIMTADLDFAGYTVSSQAFLQIEPSSQNPVGLGLIGLGPNNGSNVFTDGGSSADDAPLDRIFRQNTSTPNQITVLLGRADDPTEKVQGNLTVGDLLPGYESVASQPKLAVTRVTAGEFGNQHWQALMDANGIQGPDGKTIDTTSTVNDTTTKSQLNVVFDTGFSLPQVPKKVSDSFYSSSSGAKFENLESVGAVWTLPCDTELNVTFKFGGNSFPIHPLDTVMDVGFGNGTCIGAFQPDTTDGGDGLYDIIFGMGFLRNVYILINFGDFVDGSTSTTADPFVQLLSTSNNSAELHSDFIQARKDGGIFNSTSKSHGVFTKYRIVVLVCIVVLAALLLGILLWRRSKGKKRMAQWQASQAGASYGGGGGGTYIPLSAPAPPAATDLHAAPASYSGSVPPSYTSGPGYAPPSGAPPQQPYAQNTRYSNPFEG